MKILPSTIVKMGNDVKVQTVDILDGKKMKLFTFTKGFIATDCKNYHYGYVLKGSMEVAFSKCKTVCVYKEGDAMLIPAAEEEMHSAKLVDCEECQIIFFT